MKYLKKFNESTDYDLAFVMAKITAEFPEETINSMLEKEIHNWSDSLDAYKSLNNNEAEDIIISRLIEWYEDEYGVLTTEQRDEVYSSIKSEYKRLNF